MSGLLKFITCGSVDDGKSTLIGHLLYDAKLVYTDQERALELDSRVGSREGAIDYSLLLDGLMAEREQGITIDVAYRYFTTDRRSFIVADTPGHEEYTRNMAVGASFADLAVILVDARAGVLAQTLRHARICAMMGIRHFCFAVNKMDLTEYDFTRFREIVQKIEDLQEKIGLRDVEIIPVSATEGDNITVRSDRMPWYTGPSLLQYLEEADVEDGSSEEGFYMPVQRVCRPHLGFRGFQGQIESGAVTVGDTVRILPGSGEARVVEILNGFAVCRRAVKGQAVTIRLDREIDVSRGSVLMRAANLNVSGSIEAELLWMDDEPLYTGKNVLVRIGTRKVPGIITELVSRIDINTGEKKPAKAIRKNDIGICRLSLTDAVPVDTFARHRTMGELILIDRISNHTAACGVVTSLNAAGGLSADGSVTGTFRRALFGQEPLIAEFRPGKSGSGRRFAERIESRLASAGRHTYLYQPVPGEDAAAVLKHLYEAGLVVLLLLGEEAPSLKYTAGIPQYIEIHAEASAGDVEETARELIAQSELQVHTGADGWVI
ncbi:MAG: sulfate adenylyltransferase [Eubacterium sp.]|nr:sulfate adenylyltransferase [Eubacterium sp.]